MSKYALLCPGQGAQSPEMFQMAQGHPEAANFLQQVRVEHPKLFELSTQEIFENRWAQPLIVACTLANWKAIEREIPRPDLIAGYSIGEISAHAISGSIGFAAAIELAQTRAQLMDEAANRGEEQALMSVSGLSEEKLSSWLVKFHLQRSIVTGEQDWIVGGFRKDIDLAMKDLQQRKIQASLLPVKVASHTRLMSSAAEPFKKCLEQIQILPPNPESIVLAGVSGEKVTSTERIRSSLLEQMDHPIQWKDCVDRCVEEKIQFAFEIGPGSSLSKMFQKRHPSIPCRSLADFKSLKGAVTWISSQISKV